MSPLRIIIIVMHGEILVKINMNRRSWKVKHKGKTNLVAMFIYFHIFTMVIAIKLVCLAPYPADYLSDESLLCGRLLLYLIH